MPREGHPLWGHTLLAGLTVMHHPMEATLAHTQPIIRIQAILMVPLVLAEDLAGVEAWEEDGGKLDNWVLGAVLKYLPRLLL